MAERMAGDGARIRRMANAGWWGLGDGITEVFASGRGSRLGVSVICVILFLCRRNFSADSVENDYKNHCGSGATSGCCRFVNLDEMPTA